MTARLQRRVILGVALVGAVLLRVYILTSPMRAPNSDEAVVGLMADAIRHGARPVFYWGQPYGGTLEIALTSSAFKVFGTHDLVLKLVPVALTIVAAILTWRAARKVIGDDAAPFAGVLVLVFPPFFVYWLTKGGGYYALALALAAAAIVLVLRLRERSSVSDVAWLGLVAGVGFWTTPQAGFVIAPLVLWLAIRTRSEWRTWWPAPITFVVGAAPWLLWNARHSFGSLHAPPGLGHSTYLHRFRIFFTYSLPQMLGLKYPYTRSWRFGAIGVALYIAVLVAFAVFTIVVLARRDEWARRLEPLFVAALAYPFVFAVAPTSLFTLEPRYTTTLIPIAVLLLCVGLRRTWLQLGALALVLTLAFSTMHFLAQSHNFQIRGPEVGKVVALLDQQGAARVYADYWIAYPITFETGRRIIASPVDIVRNPEFDAAVAKADPSVYVLWRGDERDRGFPAALRSAGIGFRKYTVPRFSVYVLDRALRPDQVSGNYWATHAS